MKFPSRVSRYSKEYSLIEADMVHAVYELRHNYRVVRLTLVDDGTGTVRIETTVSATAYSIMWNTEGVELWKFLFSYDET